MRLGWISFSFLAFSYYTDHDFFYSVAEIYRETKDLLGVKFTAAMIKSIVGTQPSDNNNFSTIFKVKSQILPLCLGAYYNGIFSTIPGDENDGEGYPTSILLSFTKLKQQG